MKHLGIWLCLTICMSALGVQSADTKPCPPPPMLPGDRLEAPGNFNPILPGYFADPTIKKFGELYYLYATTDGNNGGRGPATVWVSKNFADWYCVPMNWPQTPFYWAPDVIARNGKYYLYYNQPCQVFGGEGPSPVGPWKAMKEGDNVLIPDHFVKEAITLDFQSFEDKANGFLMIERCGEKFYARTSPDGRSWTDMPRLPIVRPDIGTVSTLQVGFAHASYGDQSSWIEFRNLEILTAEKVEK